LLSDNRKLFGFFTIGVLFTKCLKQVLGKKVEKIKHKKALEMFNNEMKKAFCEMKFWTK
jgi:hypothetical protein